MWNKKTFVKNDANYLDPEIQDLKKIRLTQFENTVTLSAAAARAEIGISAYGRGKEILMVFANSTYLTKDVDYILGADAISIEKKEGSWDKGTEIHFLLFKYVTDDPMTFTDADQIDDGSIPETKLVLGIKQLLDKVRSIDAAAAKDPAGFINDTKLNLSLLDKSKVDKNGSGQVSLEMLTQSARESMTGGSVAVVGTRSVGLPQLTSTIQKDMSDLTKPEYSMIMDKHYRDIDGVAVEYSVASYHSTILPASSGDVFLISTRTSSANQTGIIYVDDNMNIKGSDLKGTGSPLVFTEYDTIAPPGATKVIFSVYGTPETYLFIEKYNYSPVAKKKIVDLMETRLSVLEKGEVLYPKEQEISILTDIHYRDVGGIATEYTFSGYHSTIYPAAPGDMFRIDTRMGSSMNQIGIIFADDSNNILEKKFYEVGTITIIKDYDVMAPLGTTKIIVSVYGDAETYLVFKKFLPEPIATERYVSDFIDSNGANNFWSGKKVVFTGDSITDPNYNGSLSHHYPSMVAESLGMSSVNYAISGSTIAINPDSPDGRTPIISRYQEMDDDADLVIVAASTNDWHYDWTPLGDMSSRDNNTFYGALHNLCLGLMLKYQEKQILFMAPVKRRQGSHDTPDAVNGNGKTLGEYAEIMKEVCGYYGIPVLDMFNESGLYPFDDTLAVKYYNQQGSEGSYYYTHPNAEGHKMMARRVTGYLRQLG
jgi:lysophospholipase L1-like esterase